MNSRKGGKKSFLFNDKNLDSLKVNNLIFLFLMPKRRFFSQFLISDEIITYFSFVFVSRIISCLALSSRKSLGKEGGFSDPVAAADYVLLCSTCHSFSSLLPSHSGLVILTPQPEAVSLIACSALMRLYEEGKDIEMFGCGVHAD